MNRHTRRHRVRRLFLLGCVIALTVSVMPVAPAAAAPKTWWVDDSGNNANAGSEAAPFRAITYAMTKAVSGDTIMVKPGTYDAPDETFPINLKAGVRLTSSGGYEATTIDANAAAHVVGILNATAGTEISGFTITDGADSFGAGIQVVNSAARPAGWPLIAENEISANTATNVGGAIAVHGGSGAIAAPTIRDNTIWNNVAGGSGGGGLVCGAYSAPLVDGNVFGANRATVGNGGGILIESDAAPDIIDCYFAAANRAAIDGGAIACLPSSPATIDIARCLFGSNRADADGGAIVVGANATTKMGECTFYWNIAAGDGGGVVVKGGTAYLWNALMYHNRATSNGAAVRVEGGSSQITNCTMWLNDGGNYGVHRVGGTCVVKNCIIGEHSGKDVYGVTVSYSFTQDADFTGDNVNNLGNVIHGDPSFIDPDRANYQLKRHSWCVDSGTNSGATAKDLLGVSRPQDGNGDGSVAAADMGAYERPLPELERYAGANRYTTACDAAKANFDEVETVVIASGENFPDALSAAGLAGSYEAPLLLVKKDDVPDVVLGTIEDLGATQAVIVGGSAVVSSVVVTQLEDEDLEVTRVFGEDRYKTSAAVAREIAKREVHISSVFIARGDDFPDALAVSPMAYSGRCPILLTKPTSLPGAIAGLFKDYDVSDAFICGGTSAVSASVASQLEALVKEDGFCVFERWSGSNRYSTAVAVAEGGYDNWWSSWDYVGVATGENFPDALSGGPVAGSYEGCVLLTKTGSLPSQTAAALSEHKEDIIRAEILGGTSAVSDGVKTAVKSALGW